MHGVDGRTGHLINLPGCGNNNNSHFGYLAHWLPDFMAQTAAASGSHVQNQHQHWPRSSLSCCWRCCVAKYVFVAFLANWQTEFAQCRWPIECSRRERGLLAVTLPVDEFPADYAIMFGHTRTPAPGVCVCVFCLPNPNCMLLTRIQHISSGPVGGESAVAGVVTAALPLETFPNHTLCRHSSINYKCRWGKGTKKCRKRKNKTKDIKWEPWKWNPSYWVPCFNTEWILYYL